MSRFPSFNLVDDTSVMRTFHLTYSKYVNLGYQFLFVCVDVAAVAWNPVARDISEVSDGSGSSSGTRASQKGLDILFFNVCTPPVGFRYPDYFISHNFHVVFAPVLHRWLV